MADEFLDLNGEIRLQGTLVAPGGLLPGGGTTGQVLTKASNAAGDADWETGGGYTPPTARENVFGDAVSIANAAIASLTWGHSSGSALLDFTDPAVPTIITAGIYCVTVQVEAASALTVGGFYECSLAMNPSGDDAALNGITSPSQTGAARSITVSLGGLPWYMPAGADITLTVHSLDGAATRNFALTNAWVQRIT